MSCRDYEALAILKFAILQRSSHCTIPLSKTTYSLLDILLNMRKIRFAVPSDCNVKGKPTCHVTILYDENLYPLLKNLKVVSTPARRVYATKSDLYRYYDLHNTIVSTHMGLLPAIEATSLNLGGEVFITFS